MRMSNQQTKELRKALNCFNLNGDRTRTYKKDIRKMYHYGLVGDELHKMICETIIKEVVIKKEL